MKIFNWVHRKFHHKEDSKKAEDSVLEEVSYNGILAIGTFGFECHPFTHFNPQNYEDQEFAVKPLLCALNPITDSNFDDETVINNNKVESIGQEMVKEECDEIRSAKRITLADLLSAHHDSAYSFAHHDVIIPNKTCNDNDDDNFYGKCNHNNKNDEVNEEESGESNKKKMWKKLLISDEIKEKEKMKKKKNSKAVHQKVKKFMISMVKKKIHPDSDVGTKSNIINYL